LLLGHDDIQTVAKYIDINLYTSQDPDGVVGKIIDLYFQRFASFNSSCKDQNCEVGKVDKKKNLLGQGEAPVTPSEQVKAQQLEELIDALFEVVPRKKITRGKRNDRSLLKYQRFRPPW
jgi:hypothetical protein